MRSLLVLLLALACACGKGAEAPVGTDDGRTAAKRTAGAEAPVAGFLVASVSERTLGPFLARRGAGVAAASMVAWITPAEGNARRVIAVPVDARGIPRGAEAMVAFVSVDTTSLVVRPMRGAQPGFVIAWTSLTDRGKSLWSVAVDDKGTPRAKPVELTRTNDDIVWVDAVPTDHGAVCLWAEETRGSDANLIAAPLDPDGKVRTSARRVAQGIVGWHALEMPNGLGVSTVTPAPDPKAKPGERPNRDARPGGSLTFLRLDADAQDAARPQAITGKGVAVSGDVEVVRSGGHLLFAWTDRSGEEPSVALAVADEKSAMPARKVVEAHGGASLLAIAAGPAGAALMYEAPARRQRETRRVHLSKIGADFAAEPRSLSVDVVGRGQPELAATDTGFAVLATTPNCEPDAPTCASAQAVATVHRTDAAGALLQREPLTFLSDPATLAWSMTCDGDLCFSLAASPGPPGTPSRIRSAAIRPRANARPAAAKKAAASTGPRVVDVTAVVAGESVADLAAARAGDGTLVALVSGKAEGAHRGDVGMLTTRLVGDAGEVGSPNQLAPRALATGGVAIAPAGSPEEGAAVAWVSRESGDPEVHVTRVDRRGRRTGDVQLTTARGDAGAVTITWAGSGWIVAWVDFRDGNGEVYAAKVGLDLARVSREERITTAPGDATDLFALANGADVWLAWADSRESPRDGLADVFVSAVRMRDAKRSFEEQRLLHSAAHSRTPHLARSASGIAAAWIEEAPLGSETPHASGYGAFHATLAGDGKPVDRPARMPLAGDGTATTVALASEGGVVRAVLARANAEAVALDAVDLASGTVTPLLALDGPPSLDVRLALEGNTLFFNDDGPRPADKRARRARIAWTR